jgi:uncharacterized YccA/Bax inhibitor family protein
MRFNRSGESSYSTTSLQRELYDDKDMSDRRARNTLRAVVKTAGYPLAVCAVSVLLGWLAAYSGIVVPRVAGYLTMAGATGGGGGLTCYRLLRAALILFATGAQRLQSETAAKSGPAEPDTGRGSDKLPRRP